MLVGWLGYYGSVLLSWLALRVSVWLIVPALSAGVVVQLAAMVVAMRVAGADARSRTLTVLAGAVLPFLCLMAAFGFVDSFAHDLFMVTAGRSLANLIDAITALDPTRSLTSALIVIGAIVALFVLRHGLDTWAEHTKTTWPMLVSVFVEASFGFLVLLSGFRLVQWVQRWWMGRQAFGWWRDGTDWLTGVIQVDVPHLIGQVIGVIWPAVWHLLAQPLAWLGLVCLVAGLRLTSSVELVRALRGGVPADEVPLPSEARSGLVARLRQALAQDFDDKVMPAVFALRYVWRAGPGFLGAFVVAFTTVGLLSEGLNRLVMWVFRSQASGFWLHALPFTGLIDKVIALSLQMVLLVVAFNMTEDIAAERTAGPPAEPSPAQALGGLVMAVVVLAAVAVGDLARNAPFVSVHRGEAGSWVRLPDMRVTAGDLRLGTTLNGPAAGPVITTNRFVVVTVSIACTRNCVRIDPQLVANGRTYDTWDGDAIALTTQPGFQITGDVTFEVLPTDLAGAVTVTFTPMQTVTTIPQVASFSFPMTADAMSAAQDETVSAVTTLKTAVAS